MAQSSTLFFGTVLLSLRLLCRAGDYVSNLDCAALRAMTGHEGVSAVMLLGIIMQLLKLCGALQILFIFPKRCHWIVILSFPKALPLG